MRRSLLVVLVLAASVWFGTSHVWASGNEGWPLDGPAETLLGFGASYRGSNGANVIHRGIDLEAGAGDCVYAALGGTVTFAGYVPAGEGATMLAVTVESEGVRLSYMPLVGLQVKVGAHVEPGATLGALASTGDSSWDAPHLHVGARIGDLYVDPMAYLTAPVPAQPKAEQQPAIEVAPVAVSQPAPHASRVTVQPAPAPATAPATAPAVVSGGVPVVAPSAASAPAGSPVAVTRGAGSGQPVEITVPTASPMGVLEEAGERGEPVTASSVRAAQVAPAIGESVIAAAAEGRAEQSPTAVPDRRARFTPDSFLARGVLVAASIALGAALLWPVWRAAANRVDVCMFREDVAAVVLK